MDKLAENKRETTQERELRPPAKGKTKTFLIGKELKTKDLHHTAAERASGPTTKPNPKPESKPRIASAKGRVKPLARLLRCATALRVTAPLRGTVPGPPDHRLSNRLTFFCINSSNFVHLIRWP